MNNFIILEVISSIFMLPIACINCSNVCVCILPIRCINYLNACVNLFPSFFHIFVDYLQNSLICDAIEFHGNQEFTAFNLVQDTDEVKLFCNHRFFL